jgi:hypothetical protein
VGTKHKNQTKRKIRGPPEHGTMGAPQVLSSPIHTQPKKMSGGAAVFARLHDFAT